jgi:hypothetical protein
MQQFFLKIFSKKQLRIFRLFYMGVWYYLGVPLLQKVYSKQFIYLSNKVALSAISFACPEKRASKRMPPQSLTQTPVNKEFFLKKTM